MADRGCRLLRSVQCSVKIPDRNKNNLFFVLTKKYLISLSLFPIRDIEMYENLTLKSTTGDAMTLWSKEDEIDFFKSSMKFSTIDDL